VFSIIGQNELNLDMTDLSKLPIGGDEVLLGLLQTLTSVPPMKLGKPKVKIVR
jgi:hypothetical protein